MRKLLYVLAFLVSGLLAKAEGTSFSGTWKLNKEKCTLNEQFSMAPGQLIIQQTADTLNVEKHGEFQGQEYVSKDKISLDGKECINVGFMDSKKKSTATWSDDGKILTVTTKVPMQDGGEFTMKETYQIDAGSLKVVMSASSPMGDMAETYGFDKQ